MSEHIVEPRVSVKQRALPDAVPAIRAAVSTFLDDLDVPRARSADIQLAVTEACANVVRHAYPGGQGDVRCEAHASDLEIVVSVADRGTTYGTRSASPGIGLGAPLMDHLCDAITRTRIDGEMVVELHFTR
jgi:anti-sigma regulatory factor (Ser/Thr protein kinase)